MFIIAMTYIVSTAVTAAVIQGQWLLHGVQSYHQEGKPFQNKLWVSDFDSLSWSEATVDGTPLDARTGHMITARKDMLMIMGGEHQLLLC